jgi:phosphatidylinositol alpha-1,6-mannosyltransferase
MNILFTALDFKSHQGGIAELTHQYAQHLQAGGDAVHVLCQDVDRAADDEFDSHCPYAVTRFDYAALRSHKIRRAMSVYSEIRNAARAHAADVIINNTTGELASFSWLASRRMGIPLCLIAHGFDVNRRVPATWRFKQNVVLRGAHAVICNSSFTADVVRSRGVPVERTPIIHPGFSLTDMGTVTAEHRAAITKRHGLAGRKVVLSVMRLVERKGVDKMIEAIPLIRKHVPEVLYLVAGEGPDRERLQNLTQQRGLQNHVQFVGRYVAGDEKATYYDLCHVFAMPSREMTDGSAEGFGIVFLEANAYGKPVVGGNAGGVGDAVEDGRTGLLVDPTEPSDIASAVVRLLQDESLADRLGRYGRERVARDYPWKTIVARVRETLGRVVEGGR